MHRCLLNFLAVSPLLLAGCQSYVPVSVQVFEAETGAGIVGAKVESQHMPPGMSLFGSKPSSALTDQRGRAVVRISDAPAMWRGATAVLPGYLQARALFPPGQFKHLRRDRRHSRAVAASAQPDLTVKLYKEPHPYFVLIVPNGYRGLLRLDESAPSTERQLSPSERAVEVALRPPAPQKLPRCRLGGHVINFLHHYTARYEDGTPIPSLRHGRPNGNDIALRWVSGHNMRYIYVIGTETDVQSARDQIHELFEDFDKLWSAAAPP